MQPAAVVVVHLFLFAFLGQQVSSNPVYNGPTESTRFEQKPDSTEERFGISSSVSFGVNPELGLGADAGGGGSAYPNNYNIGSGTGGNYGYPGGLNEGSFGSYSQGYNNGGPAGYPSGYPSSYNSGSFANYPPRYKVNGGMNSYPPRYPPGYTSDYNHGGYNNMGNSFGGASPYGSSVSSGFGSGFACGSSCGEHIRRCSTACSKDFWTYLCVLCVGPKWDSCRPCFA
uniref:Uncharacterized protein n=1 Tax=Plectus sambesii TaxID=2011161 RepID=A0A914VCD1_9BILA